MASTWVTVRRSFLVVPSQTKHVKGKANETAFINWRLKYVSVRNV